MAITWYAVLDGINGRNCHLRNGSGVEKTPWVPASNSGVMMGAMIEYVIQGVT